MKAKAIKEKNETEGLQKCPNFDFDPNDKKTNNFIE